MLSKVSTFWKKQDWLGPRLNRNICVFWSLGR